VGKFFCLGCGVRIPWDGKGLFAYTCRCRATAFRDEKWNLSMPVSFWEMLKEGREPPHIDYYLGVTKYTSPLKEQVYELLRKLGAVYSWECDECRENIVRFVRADVELGAFQLEDLRPELAEMLRAECHWGRRDKSG